MALYKKNRKGLKIMYFLILELSFDEFEGYEEYAIFLQTILNKATFKSYFLISM